MQTQEITKAEATASFSKADDAWGRELIAVFGKGACNARYLPQGKGVVGSSLRRLHDEREASREAWEAVAFDRSAA